MERSREMFSTYHPAVSFLFFIAAAVFAMFFIHPAFLTVSVVLSMAYLITVRRRKAIKLILILAAVFVAVAFINPLIDPNGHHVLFTWAGGRPYTLEALFYGMAVGGMFVTVIMWFASYNSVMTSDKFLYLFGRAAPSITLVITMVLRLMPNFRMKAAQISGARRAVGKGYGKGSREKAENGLAVLSSMTTWALEGGIVTSDSMKSRGFGTARRTGFSVYRFEGRDKALLLVMAALAATVIFCGLNGAAETVYVPETRISSLDSGYALIGASAYFIFLAIPTIINITEAAIWHNLRSGI